MRLHLKLQSNSCGYILIIVTLGTVVSTIRPSYFISTTTGASILTGGIDKVIQLKAVTLGDFYVGINNYMIN